MTIAIQSPSLSPSLNEFGPAVITDENSHVLPVVVVLPVDANGHTNSSTLTITEGLVSEVTDRKTPPMINTPGGKKIPAVGLISVDSSGNPIPFAVPASVTTAIAAAISTVAPRNVMVPVSPAAGTYVVPANKDLIRLANNGDVATLPAATGSGRIIAVTNVGAGTITINVAGGTLAIKGANSIAIFTQWSSFIFCDGAVDAWDIIGSN